MIIDGLGEFADAAAFSTAATGMALIGDVIDLGSTSQALGVGEPLYCVLQIDTAVTSGGSATVQLVLASDAQAAIATNGTATVHFQTAAIPKATLVAGYTAAAFILPSGTYERYVGVLQNVATAALTAGKLNAFLTHDISAWTAYPDAIS